MQKFDRSLVWFRRDLRNFDHAALHYALATSRIVHCVFVFDREILDPLLEYGLQADRRVEFIHASVRELAQALNDDGGELLIRHAFARTEIPRLAAELDVQAVLINRDYEPAAVARDDEVASELATAGRQLLSFKDQVIFEKGEVLSQMGKPFSVFTPYKNAWVKKLMPDPGLPASDNPSLGQWLLSPALTALAPPRAQHEEISLQQLGFEKTNLMNLGIATGMQGGQALIEDFESRLAIYDSTRNFPAVKGPSYLSVHLRFGTVSVRSLVRMALDRIATGEGGSGAAVWLSELIWRDFYFAVLHHFPHVVGHAFRPEYDRIAWEQGLQADEHFAAWREGRTGYPLVDAAMLQLNQTGYMHNRLRMVTASFLSKDLGIDWRRGERYFADRLIDYDLSANNGGWQWAASTGCDAQPWFRIFNPVTQSEKFDPEGKFIRRYLPQLKSLATKYLHAPWLAPLEVCLEAGVAPGKNYPLPIVAHDEARKRTLERYGVVKKPG